MDIISQEDAKIKIKEWLLLSETDDQIKEKLANYGFVDVVVDNLLNEARPKTIINTDNPNPSLASTELSVTPESISQTQIQKPKNIFDFKNIKGYEWLALLPAFILLVQGGAIGGGIGVLGWSWSLKIIRNESKSKTAKIFGVIGATIAYYAIYFISSILFIGIIQGLFGK